MRRGRAASSLLLLLSACNQRPSTVLAPAAPAPASAPEPQAAPPAASAPPAREVRVLRATYGRRCGTAGGNHTAFVERACNGKERCEFVVDNRDGDPAPNCPKDFSVEWQCGREPTAYYDAHEAVAGEGYTVLLTCGDDKMAAERVLLRDEFKAPRLDPGAWAVDSAIPQGNAGVVAENGRVELRNRGHLNTVNSFDPAVFGGIRVTGEWTLSEPGDFIEIVTRSDGAVGDQFGGVRSGIHFGAFLAWGAMSQKMAIDGFGQARVANTAPVSFTMVPGETFVFEVIDTFPHLSFTLTRKGDPARTATVTGESLYRAWPSLITFHNREFQGVPRVAYLRDVLVTTARREKKERQGR